MEIKEDIYISFVIAGKLDPADKEYIEKENKVSTCCGRNWWYWKPFFRKTNIGFDFFWLCFLVSYDNYNKILRKHRKDQKNQQSIIKDTL